ncbi:glycosyltransferase [candidate division KSB1 bacterium]|nr:glycosyltransferase [candidate division KSB1 bacterium]RQW01938.1 MAG: glycosyltransferase [candidate division KSB1 bacterium]
MFTLVTLLLLALGSYIFLGLLLRGNIAPVPAFEQQWLPSVSVIVAAKNEEAYLRECLSALGQLDYPEEKLEIIIVNDASTDRSAEIIETFQQNISTLIHIRLAEGEKPKQGKAGALLIGIEKSHGEILFITDADCIVPPTWIREVLLGFREHIGVVGGFTLLIQPANLWQKIQAYDWRFLLSIAAAASQLNKPISWVGNNLAVRRSTYEQVGGYQNLDAGFVEDFVLIDVIERETAWQCRFFASPNSIVRTHAADTVSQLIAQRKRWGIAISAARPFGWWIMLTGFASHFLILISLFVAPLWGAIALLAKCSVDFLIFTQSKSALQEPFNTSGFLLYEIYAIFHSILLPLLLLVDRRILWKGEQLSIPKNVSS